MKQRILLFISLFIVISSINTPAQVLVTKKDSIPLGKDTSVLLKLPVFRGNSIWQKSLDNQNWTNLQGKNQDTLSVKSNIEAVYRASVSDGTCLPVYSDSAAIITFDTISKDFVEPVKEGLVLISDSTGISNGKYTYTGAGTFNGFELGKVIIEEQSGGTIRKITGIIQNGDTAVVKTEQATMEDLFRKISFKLSTSMLYPSINLKSSSPAEIQKALTDKDGFIHPVEVIYKTKSGEKIKSLSIYSKNENTQNGPLYMHRDWSGLVFLDKSGTFELQQEDGTYDSFTGNVKSYISEGYFTFDPDFKFEYEFDWPEFDWRKLKISKGEIKKFKFYSDRSKIEFKNILAFESSIAYEFGKEWTLVPDIIPLVSIKFLVFGVPVWVDIKADINCSLGVSFGSGFIITQGFQNTSYLTLGAGYENRVWYPINLVEKDNKVFSSFSRFGNMEVSFSIYPSIEMKLYSILGPSFEFGPYLSGELVASSSQNWNSGIDIGAEAGIGVSAEVFGKEILSYSPAPWNIFEVNLFNSPTNLLLIDGDNQEAQKGEELPSPVIVKVTNSWDQPVGDVQVYFSPASGSVEHAIVVTDATGLAQTTWKLSADAGEHRLKVYMKDGKDLEFLDCTLTIYATALSTGVPTVITSPVDGITQTVATCGGNVTSQGSAPVTARGVCWNITGNPTLADSKTSDGAGTGTFISSLLNLTAGTTYFAAAYATNNLGTAYGEQKEFTTAGGGTGTFTDNRDGKVYTYKAFGNQTWMTENMNFSSAGSWCYSNNLQKCTDYGRLYTYSSAVTVCPGGWHLPTDGEWQLLETFLGMSSGDLGLTGFRGTTQGSMLKLGGSSGFNAKLGGWRSDVFNSFSEIDTNGYFWSSTSPTASDSWGRKLSLTENRVGRYKVLNNNGLSVRCVKN